MKLHWQFVFLATIVLYILIIITLPFNPVYATIFLFTLIGFWSRLPGVGIYHPLWILYNMDLVDVFVLIIAVNGYVAEAIVASIFMNLYSRACGVFPTWGPVVHDTIAMAVVLLIIHPLHALFGGNILYTMAAFTIIRACIWPIFAPFTYNIGIVRYTIEWISSVIQLLFFNGIYLQLFGRFFDNLLGSGVAFSWPLFIFATIVIFVFYYGFKGKSKSDVSLTKGLIRLIKPKKKKHVMQDSTPGRMERVHGDVPRGRV